MFAEGLLCVSFWFYCCSKGFCVFVIFLDLLPHSWVNGVEQKFCKGPPFLSSQASSSHSWSVKTTEREYWSHFPERDTSRHWVQELRSQKHNDFALGCQKPEYARAFDSDISVNLLARLFLMIKIGDLGKGDSRGWGGLERRGDPHAASEGQSLPRQTQHYTAGLKALVAPLPSSPCTLVHDDRTKTSVYSVIRTSGCLWSPQPSYCYRQAYLIHPVASRFNLPAQKSGSFASWVQAAQRV